MGIAAIFTLAAGGGVGPPPTYVSTHGVPYFESSPNEWHRAEIETQESAFIANASMGLNPPGVVDAVAHTWGVNVVDAAFACSGSPTGRCNGQELNGELEVVNLGCPYNSALAHEMLHWVFGYLRNGDNDPQHLDPLWQTVDVPAGVCE